MKTIEERAKEWVTPVDPLIKIYDEGRERGYIKGATEQKQIDIEKACAWLLNNVFANMESPDTNCYLKSGWYMDFRKAMEE